MKESRVAHAVRTLTAVLLGTAMLSGCAPKTDYSARFLRYEALSDGTRVAVVEPLAAGADTEQQAFTKLTDLSEGEIVYVRWVGKDWDQAQTAPEREIVSRAR